MRHKKGFGHSSPFTLIQTLKKQTAPSPMHAIRYFEIKAHIEVENSGTHSVPGCTGNSCM